MTKVTIDDTDYESENFNEEQNNILHELQNNQSVSATVQYQLHSLTVLRDMLINKLRTSLAGENINEV